MKYWWCLIHLSVCLSVICVPRCMCAHTFLCEFRYLQTTGLVRRSEDNFVPVPASQIVRKKGLFIYLFIIVVVILLFVVYCCAHQARWPISYYSGFDSPLAVGVLALQMCI